VAEFGRYGCCFERFVVLVSTAVLRQDGLKAAFRGKRAVVTKGNAEFNKVEALSKLSLAETVAVFQNSTLVRSSFSGNHFTAGQVDS